MLSQILDHWDQLIELSTERQSWQDRWDQAQSGLQQTLQELPGNEGQRMHELLIRALPADSLVLEYLSTAEVEKKARQASHSTNAEDLLADVFGQRTTIVETAGLDTNQIQKELNEVLESAPEVSQPPSECPDNLETELARAMEPATPDDEAPAAAANINDPMPEIALEQSAESVLGEEITAVENQADEETSIELMEASEEPTPELEPNDSDTDASPLSMNEADLETPLANVPAETAASAEPGEEDLDLFAEMQAAMDAESPTNDDSPESPASDASVSDDAPVVPEENLETLMESMADQVATIEPEIDEASLPEPEPTVVVEDVESVAPETSETAADDEDLFAAMQAAMDAESASAEPTDAAAETESFADAEDTQATQVDAEAEAEAEFGKPASLAEADLADQQNAQNQLGPSEAAIDVEASVVEPAVVAKSAVDAAPETQDETSADDAAEQEPTAEEVLASELAELRQWLIETVGSEGLPENQLFKSLREARKASLSQELVRLLQEDPAFQRDEGVIHYRAEA